MKIIEKGKHGDLKDWTLDKRCERDGPEDLVASCGALIRISFKDLSIYYWHGTHFKHEYAGFRCPQCNKILGVNLPDPLWKKLKAKHWFKKPIFDGFSEVL